MTIVFYRLTCAVGYNRLNATKAKYDPVKALVSRVAADAGYELANSWTDRDLKLYFDVLSGGMNIGCISRGWTDLGYRISEQIVVSAIVEGRPMVRPAAGFLCHQRSRGYLDVRRGSARLYRWNSVRPGLTQAFTCIKLPEKIH